MIDLYFDDAYEYDIFKIYELESVSIGINNYMYASVNVELLPGSSYTQYQRDPIILIKRPNKVDNSDQFLVGNITS